MNILKKKEYLDCEWMKYSLHFFYDNIRMCCSNATGIIFYDNCDKCKVDWDYIYNTRKKCVKNINSFFGKYPKECAGCCEIPTSTKTEPVKAFDNKVKRLYIQNFMSCNAKCVYCTFDNIERGYKYKVLPLVKELIEKEILSKIADVYMSGGEITISPEFEELLSTLTDYLDSQIEIFTSGIKYCKSIENAFVNNKLRMLISLDSSNAETYKKIKLVNCFDTVVDNIRSYINASEYAKENITVKYILQDGLNDNKEELTGFINLVENLGVKNIRLDVDYVKYSLGNGNKIPEHYHELYEYFNKKCNEYGLNIKTYSQVNEILKKN